MNKNEQVRIPKATPLPPPYRPCRQNPNTPTPPPAPPPPKPPTPTPNPQNFSAAAVGVVIKSEPRRTFSYVVFTTRELILITVVFN